MWRVLKYQWDKRCLFTMSTLCVSLWKFEASIGHDSVSELVSQRALLLVVGQFEQVETRWGCGEPVQWVLLAYGEEATYNTAYRVTFTEKVYLVITTSYTAYSSDTLCRRNWRHSYGNPATTNLRHVFFPLECFYYLLHYYLCLRRRPLPHNELKTEAPNGRNQEEVASNSSLQTRNKQCHILI